MNDQEIKEINLKNVALEELAAEDSFYYFYEKEYCYKKTGWKKAKHPIEFCEYMEGTRRDLTKKGTGVNLVLLAPRDHLKSSIAEAYCMWRIKYHQERGYIFSVNQTLANGKVTNIKEEIENNEKFHDLIPRSKDDKWSGHELRFDRRHKLDTTKTTWLKSRGYGAAIRGEKPDFIVLDDIYGDDKNPSLFKHEFIIRFFKQAIINLLREEDYASTLIIGTKNDIGDLYDELKDNKAFTHVVYKALPHGYPDPDKRCLWPEMWSYDKLMSRREKIDDDISFNKEYQNEIKDHQASLFPLKEMLIKRRNEEVEIEDIRMQDTKTSKQRYILSIDPPNNFMILRLSPFNKVYICDYRQPPVSQDTDLLYYIKAYNNVFRFDSIVIEENYIKMITDQIRDLRLPIKLYSTGTKDSKETAKTIEKVSKTNMITRLHQPFKNRIFFFPYADGRAKKMTNLLFDELNRLRLKNGKIEEVGKHTHSPICLGAAWHFIKGMMKRRHTSGIGF